MEEVEGTSNYFMQSYSYIIVIMASVLRIIMIWMAGFVLIKTRSHFAAFIIKPILLQYMISYILVQFLATYDLRGHLFFTEESQKSTAMGIYLDFTSNWFLDVGFFIQDMLFFNILLPPLEFLAFWTWRYM